MTVGWEPSVNLFLEAGAVLKRQPGYILTTSLSIMTAQLSKQPEHRLLFALNRVSDVAVPFRLRLATYLRLLATLAHDASGHGSTGNSMIASIPTYSEILLTLSSCDPCWWTHCHINEEGLPVSANRHIDDCLRPFNDLVRHLLQQSDQDAACPSCSGVIPQPQRRFRPTIRPARLPGACASAAFSPGSVK